MTVILQFLVILYWKFAETNNILTFLSHFWIAFLVIYVSIGFEIEDNEIDYIVNLTPFQYSPFTGCNDYHEEEDDENARIPQGANIRGISVSAARYVLLHTIRKCFFYSFYIIDLNLSSL